MQSKIEQKWFAKKCIFFSHGILFFFSPEKRPSKSKNLPILCVQKIILLSNARPHLSSTLSMAHSSEIRGLSSTKCCSETLQNLLYFMCIFIFHFMQLYFFPYAKLHKMKNDKKYICGFSFAKNIANVEAFHRNIFFSANFLFRKSGHRTYIKSLQTTFVLRS